jgi:hypothetical protein
MKKIIALSVLVAACSSSPTPSGVSSTAPAPRTAPSGSMTGAASAEAAVKAYLDASKARDLQAMSAVWGTTTGSVRETMDRQSMEQRGTIVMGLLCPESYEITSSGTGQGGRRNYRVALKRGTKAVDVSMITVKGPQNRWYVEDFPLDGDLPQRLQQLCR